MKIVEGPAAIVVRICLQSAESIEDLCAEDVRFLSNARQPIEKVRAFKIARLDFLFGPEPVVPARVLSAPIPLIRLVVLRKGSSQPNLMDYPWNALPIGARPQIPAVKIAQKRELRLRIICRRWPLATSL